MDAIELTKLFVDYAEAIKKADKLKTQIEAEVLGIGETQKIAGVTATYYKAGFETPDYKFAAQLVEIPIDIVEKYTTHTTSVRWAEVCKELNIEVLPGAEKPARVTVKIA